LRLVHPFPSVLNGVVVMLVAAVAGGAPERAAMLGISMMFLQFSIGALNDVTDIHRDAGRRRDKPIPGGVVSEPLARAVAAACAAAGLGLALLAGPALLLLALAGLATGAVYDLRVRGTTLSWLPIAVGIPLLPVYGWFGATGTLPGVFLVLVPAAANAGTALAIANAIVDMEHDETAGNGSIALALGAGPASALVLALHLVVAALALGTAVVLGAPGGWLAAMLLAAGAPIAGALVGIGGAVRRSPTLHELAWEIQALGTGLLAVAWLGALSASSSPIAGG
jgi:4-hydroxybenzoate polyprenyltransferase